MNMLNVYAVNWNIENLLGKNSVFHSFEYENNF